MVYPTMEIIMDFKKRINLRLFSVFILLSLTCPPSFSRDLADIKADGILTHIGIPYARFVTYYEEGTSSFVGGLDADLIRGFAHSLGVKYKFVPASRTTQFPMLIGKSVHYSDNLLVLGKESHPIQGDLIAQGNTIFPWRQEIIDYSTPYFPSAIWLVARANVDLTPIQPSGSLEEDIKQVRSMLAGREILSMENTSLDADLYDLRATDAKIVNAMVGRQINEMVPAILNYDAEMTLLDMIDTLVALKKWPGEIKVIGPISKAQLMGVAFRKNSPQLRAAFNEYLRTIKRNGEYNKLVLKYYPSIFYLYPDFFKNSDE